MKDKKLPNIPYNLPITMDLPETLIGHPDYIKEKRDMFYTLLNSGDFKDIKYRKVVDEQFGENKSEVISKSLEVREIRAKELQAKSWDIDYIREHGFDYFPSDEYLRDTVFKGKTFFKGVRDYQITDAYMLSKSTNMLITHGMRLGKTMITTMGMLNNPKVNSVMVVAPKVTLPDWKDTINTWTEKRMTAKIVSADFKPAENIQAIEEWMKGEINVIVVNIDHFMKYSDEFVNNPENIDLLVVDEAHFLANRNENDMMLLTGKKAQALLLYRKQNVKFCWLLTGTPTKKAEYEILGLFYFMSPSNRTTKGKGLKLDNYKWFFKKFCSIDSIPSPANGFRFEVSNKAEYDLLLRELNLNHRIHRTTRDEFPDASEKIFEDVVLDMNASQKKAYKSIQSMLKAMFLEIDNALARDTYLRQIALDHRLMKRAVERQLAKLEIHEDPIYVEMFFKQVLQDKYSKNIHENIKTIMDMVDSKYGFDKKGSKSEWLLQYLKENKDYIQGNKLSDDINGSRAEEYILQKGIVDEKEIKTIKEDFQKQGRNPIVIFSQFKQFLHFFKQDMETTPVVKDLSIELITGDNAKDREDIRQRFQNGEIDVLLIQVDTVKTGTALFRSNTAIFADRKFSNQDMLQAYERINHPDSKDVKMTYHLMTEGTIDFDVKERNELYDQNTRYMNEGIMADITDRNKNAAKALFEKYLNNIGK